MSKAKGLFSGLDVWLPKEWASRDEQLRKGRQVLASALVGIFLCAASGVIFVFMEHWIGVAACIFGIMGSAVSLVLLQRTRRTSIAGTFFSASCFVFFAVLIPASDGTDSLMVVWLFMAPLSALLSVGVRSGVMWAFLTFLLFAVLVLLDAYDVLAADSIAPRHQYTLNFVAFSLFLLVSSLSIIGNEQVKVITLKRLQKTKEEIMEKQEELEGINEKIVLANKDLEEKVRLRTQRLELSKQELDTFLYESSHALRRPVVRLLGLGSVLRIADSAEERESYLQAIEVTTKGMDKMLTDLLEVSELNSMAVNMREIHLPAFLVHLSESMGSEKMDLVCEVEGSKPIMADGFMLGLALRKLLENAIEYRKEGQVKARIHIRAKQEEGKWRIVVRDAGKGIHPEAQGEVLKMFVRGTEASTGTGLGLYIADKAVRRMEGELKLESELGEWTEVVISLKG